MSDLIFYTNGEETSRIPFPTPGTKCPETKLEIKMIELVNLQECLNYVVKVVRRDDRTLYGKIRMYTFLAERFLSYWFQKNYRVKEFPIIVKDLSDYKNL